MLFGDTLGFRFLFHAKGCERRPELGAWNPYRIENGLLKLHAGAEVRIAASIPPSPPVEFEAMPLGAYCSDINVRSMTANLSVQPGVYRWPPVSSIDDLSAALEPDIARKLAEGKARL